VPSGRVERKLAAILAADVAGYSRLMGADEEGTLARLKAHRKELIEPKLAEHRGRVVKTTGDGILIEFPSVVDAVRCAVEVQQVMARRNAEIPDEKQIKFRIGINVGDIIIDGEDIHGDGVNIAARLEGIAEPGGICLSEAAYQQVRDKLDYRFEDMGERSLKNIARPVRVYGVPPSAQSAKERTALTLPDKPSIAVLPFQNMSGDPEQEYFADGMVEEIITALSRFHWLFVIARNSSFVFKGKPVDVKQVSRDLGVRYILEGSVRKAANRVRIAGQLIDASTGTHLWADRFEGALEDIFQLQDQVTTSVVGAIEPRLQRAEIERSKRKPTENLDAYDYFLRGLESLHLYTPEGIDNALGLFTKAIALDPDYASAYGMAARCYSLRKVLVRASDAHSEKLEAERLARRAAGMGKDDSVALYTAGFVLLYVVGDVAGGAALIERSLMLNRNDATALYLSGFAHAYLGEPDKGIEHVHEAMRLNPLDPLIHWSQAAMGYCHFVAGRHEEAAAWSEKAMVHHPDHPTASRVGTAAYGLLGRHEDAARLLARVRKLYPNLRVSTLKDVQGVSASPALIAKFQEGLRRAGLPE